MKMKFNELTKERPVYLLPDGFYNAKIATAELKQGTERPYINLRLDVFDDEGKRLSGIFDVISEVPEKKDGMTDEEINKIDTLSNKLYNFLMATEISVPEEFELKDILDNISQAKEFKVQISTRRQGGYPPRNIVNINQGGYFSLTEVIDEEEADAI